MPEPTPVVPSQLAAWDFAGYYQTVHAVDPFPWQQELVGRVLSDGAWPDLVDVPTGLGKTSMLDVAVFVAAATAGTRSAERLGRRRSFFVVDRRIVVDEAHEHAQRIVTALRRAGDDPTGVIERVRAALRSYAPDAPGEALTVTRMRGGTTWEAAWLDRPDRPGIVLGTVDQVGSRLLFRGYGVSDRRRPIDAALVGTDALLMVDEAHLSTALLTTVTAAQERDWTALPVPGLSVIRLSATPGEAGDPARRVYSLDVEAHRRHPEAGRRLAAGKTLTCVTTSAKDCVRTLADTVLDECAGLVGAGSPPGRAPTALVVCNTVDRARAVHALLVRQLSTRPATLAADCDLLIGRSRPLDRPDLQDHVLGRFGTGRAPLPRTAILVATQTVEVGINLDVDVLVSESASWDALVQRFGRLNRLGRFTERFPGRPAATAVVVHDGQQEGPVYGAARDVTWDALVQVTGSADDGLDVSPLGCRGLASGSLGSGECVRRPVGVPLLQRPTLDAWAQTAPVPLNDPPIQPFLHGFASGAAAVQVAWRDGLLADGSLDDPFSDEPAEAEAARAGAMLTALPVRSAELVEVPFIAVREWMLGQTPGPVSDLETEPETEGRSRQERSGFRVLAWRSDAAGNDDRSGAASSWRWITGQEVRPGDRIVAPSERGGLDRYGWSPADTARVADVSEAATFVPSRGQGDATLRLDRALPGRLGLSDAEADEVSDAMLALRSGDDGSADSIRVAVQRIQRALRDGLPAEPPQDSGWSTSAWIELRRWLDGRVRLVEVLDYSADVIADGSGPPMLAHLLAGRRATSRSGGEAEDGVERDDEDVAGSSLGSVPVTLAVHLAAVGARARRIAQALGLPDDLCTVVEDAARWHDLGKVEERFQIMLHGGDAAEAALSIEPLAKSGMDAGDRLAGRRARLLSRLPGGARHEAWSMALVEEHLRTRDDAYPGDADLVLHLIASHHGHARPFLPLVVDGEPRLIEALVEREKVSVPSERTVSLEHPSRFTRLNTRYGRWGLALLESVVRCADMTVSREGS